MPRTLLSEIQKLIEQRKYQEVISVIDAADLSDPLVRAESYVYRTEAMMALGEYESSFVDEALGAC
jgi:hypothetical protein